MSWGHGILRAGVGALTDYSSTETTVQMEPSDSGGGQHPGAPDHPYRALSGTTSLLATGCRHRSQEQGLKVLSLSTRCLKMGPGARHG